MSNSPSTSITNHVQQLLTFSALDYFRRCPMRYHLRYQRCLVRATESEAQTFGHAAHLALEHFYKEVHQGQTYLVAAQRTLTALPQLLPNVLPATLWTIEAIIEGYAARYAQEDASLKIIAVEKEFRLPLRNPTTGARSRTFDIAGKVDLVAQQDDRVILFDHKFLKYKPTNFTELLWTNTQLNLYALALNKIGIPVNAVAFNIVRKTGITQSPGWTEEEYEEKLREAAAKNKSGRSTLKRKMPETDEQYRERLRSWYQEQEAFHREILYLDKQRLELVNEEIWEISQAYLHYRMRGKWLPNTSACSDFGRCPYLDYCASGYNDALLALYKTIPPHIELSQFQSYEKETEQ